MKKFKKSFRDRNGNLVLTECHHIGYKRDGEIWRVFKPDDVYDHPLLKNSYTLVPCRGSHAPSKQVLWNDAYPPFETTLLPIQYYKVLVQAVPVEAAVVGDIIGGLSFYLPVFPYASQSVNGQWRYDNITPIAERGPAPTGYTFIGDDVKMIGIFRGHLEPHDLTDDYRDPTREDLFIQFVQREVQSAEPRAQVFVHLTKIHTLRQVLVDGKLDWIQEEEVHDNAAWI